jgi:hypothetical protein
MEQADEIRKNGSNIIVKTSPTKSNAYSLKIAPIFSEVSGSVKVVDLLGRVVWEGNVSEETEIKMNEFPKGVYFIVGTGKSIPIKINK